MKSHVLSDIWEDFYGWRFRCTCGYTGNVPSTDPEVAMEFVNAHIEQASKPPKVLAAEPIPGQSTIYDYMEDTEP